MVAMFYTAACHTGGANVVQADKTLQKDALVAYLDGGFNVDAIVKQARIFCGHDLHGTRTMAGHANVSQNLNFASLSTQNIDSG